MSGGGGDGGGGGRGWDEVNDVMVAEEPGQTN